MPGPGAGGGRSAQGGRAPGLSPDRPCSLLCTPPRAGLLPGPDWHVAGCGPETGGRGCPGSPGPSGSGGQGGGRGGCWQEACPPGSTALCPHLPSAPGAAPPRRPGRWLTRWHRTRRVAGGCPLLPRPHFRNRRPLGLGHQPRGPVCTRCRLPHLPFSRCGRLGRGSCLNQTRARWAGTGRGGRQMCLCDSGQAHGCVPGDEKVLFAPQCFCQRRVGPLSKALSLRPPYLLPRSAPSRELLPTWAAALRGPGRT